MKETYLERYVQRLLQDKGIKTINDMTIERLSEAFDIHVFYKPYGTCMKTRCGVTVIMIDSRVNETEQYHQFIHELAHLICHHTSIKYLNNNQWKYYELKAEKVVKYITIPSFLISGYTTVEEVSEEFHVSYDLAMKRLEAIKNRNLILRR